MALNLGGSDEKKKIILFGGLAVVIVVTVIIVMVTGLTGSGRMSDGWEDVPFICRDKDEHFFVKYQDLPRRYQERSASGEKVFLDCPKCGKSASAAPAIHCPNTECRKFYPRYYSDAETGQVIGNSRCPYCGIAPHQWDEKHR